jgi:hypothetical protein
LEFADRIVSSSLQAHTAAEFARAEGESCNLDGASVDAIDGDRQIVTE